MRKSKVMLTILAAAMAASLTACGGSSDKGAATTAAAAGGSDTKTEAAGSTASADAINFTMSLVDNTSSNYYKGAEKIAEHPGRRHIRRRERYTGHGSSGRP